MEQNGTYESLNVHAERLEALASDGIVYPEKAAEICRRIRTELYALRQAIKETCVPAGPRGPAAA
jgi:hypothetical protein